VATEAELPRAARLTPLLEHWFVGSGRTFPWRSWVDPYRLTVVEVLLQRTRAETVAAFAPRFFEDFPGWKALAESAPGELEAYLAPIGLQGRRGASLRSLASHVLDHGEEMSEAAPGVGQYISRAVAVALRGAPVAMIDSNWVRVIRRVFAGPWMADYRWDPRLQRLANAVVEGGADARHVNWAVLDLGAMLCRPKRPQCGACPLLANCGTGLLHDDSRTGALTTDRPQVRPRQRERELLPARPASRRRHRTT
jgi:A/G-specific adenine glycosylase